MANIPVVVIFSSLTWISGCVIYAMYYQCDPMKIGYTQKMDEIFPFFIQDKLAYIPGCIGLFLATLFNGALWYKFRTIFPTKKSINHKWILCL